MNRTLYQLHDARVVEERSERGERGEEGSVSSTPSTPGFSRSMFTPRSSEIRAQVCTLEDQKKKAQQGFENMAEEKAHLKSDPRNEHFTEVEERAARGKVRDAVGGLESKEKDGAEKVWKESLQKTLVALLQTTTIALCRKKMAQLDRRAIESCARGGRSWIRRCCLQDGRRWFLPRHEGPCSMTRSQR